MDFAKFCDLRPRRAKQIFEQVREAIYRWDLYVAEAKVPEELATTAWRNVQLDLPAN